MDVKKQLHVAAVKKQPGLLFSLALLPLHHCHRSFLCVLPFICVIRWNVFLNANEAKVHYHIKGCRLRGHNTLTSFANLTPFPLTLCTTLCVCVCVIPQSITVLTQTLKPKADSKLHQINMIASCVMSLPGSHFIDFLSSTNNILPFVLFLGLFIFVQEKMEWVCITKQAVCFLSSSVIMTN